MARLSNLDLFFVSGLPAVIGRAITEFAMSIVVGTAKLIWAGIKQALKWCLSNSEEDVEPCDSDSSDDEPTSIAPASAPDAVVAEPSQVIIFRDFPFIGRGDGSSDSDSDSDYDPATTNIVPFGWRHLRR